MSDVRRCLNGHEVPEGLAFCPECGAQTGPGRLLSAAPSPRAPTPLTIWPLIVGAAIAIGLGVLIGVLLTPGESATDGGPTTGSAVRPASTTEAPESTDGEPAEVLPGISALPVGGECDAVEVSDECEPSCQTALAAMTIGTNPALSDVLVYEVGYVELSLADGSELRPGVRHPIGDYVVDLAARYPNDVVTTSRWGVPPPGESSQYGEGTFGFIDAEPTVPGGIEAQSVVQSGQFMVAGGRCFENET